VNSEKQNKSDFGIYY